MTGIAGGERGAGFSDGQSLISKVRRTGWFPAMTASGSSTDLTVTSNKTGIRRRSACSPPRPSTSSRCLPRTHGIGPPRRIAPAWTSEPLHHRPSTPHPDPPYDHRHRTSRRHRRRRPTSSFTSVTTARRWPRSPNDRFRRSRQATFRAAADARGVPSLAAWPRPGLLRGAGPDRVGQLSASYLNETCSLVR